MCLLGVATGVVLGVFFGVVIACNAIYRQEPSPGEPI